MNGHKYDAVADRQIHKENLCVFDSRNRRLLCSQRQVALDTKAARRWGTKRYLLWKPLFIDAFIEPVTLSVTFNSLASPIARDHVNHKLWQFPLQFTNNSILTEWAENNYKLFCNISELLVRSCNVDLSLDFYCLRHRLQNQ